MNKNFTLYILIGLITFFSCTTHKKVQKITTAITKKDTTEVVKVKETPKVDSVAIVKNIIKDVQNNSINFNTFYAKVKVDYEGANDSKKFTVYLYIRKDTSIVMRLVGSFMGISKEGVVAKITKDSVTVVNKLDKTVQYRKLAYLQELTKIPFDYFTIQNILIGNPIFLDSNIVSYKNSDEYFTALVIGKVFKHLLTLDKNDYKMLFSKLDDVDELRNRTCNITYQKYENTGGYNFSTLRKISVAEKTKLDVTLDFNQYLFNQPITYNFSVPKSFKKQ